MKPVSEIMRSVKLVKIGTDSSNKSGSTNKYWKAKVVGKMLITSHGKNGKNGNIKQEIQYGLNKYVLSSIYAARNKLHEIIQSKLDKQYQIVYSF